MDYEEQETITKRYMRFVLRRYRKQAGLSLDQVAHKVGISKGFYSNMELGTKWPNIDMLLRIAEALDVRPGDMLDALVEESRKTNNSE